MSHVPADRAQNARTFVIRALAVTSAICLATGYIVFAQMNARRQPSAISGNADSIESYSFANPAEAKILLAGDGISITAAPREDWSDMRGYVASSSKSISVAREVEPFAFLAVKMFTSQSPRPGKAVKPGPDKLSLDAASGAPPLELTMPSDTNPLELTTPSDISSEPFLSVLDVRPQFGRMPMESAFLSPFSAAPTPAPYR